MLKIPRKRRDTLNSIRVRPELVARKNITMYNGFAAIYNIHNYIFKIVFFFYFINLFFIEFNTTIFEYFLYTYICYIYIVNERVILHSFAISCSLDRQADNFLPFNKLLNVISTIVALKHEIRMSNVYIAHTNSEKLVRAFMRSLLLLVSNGKRVRASLLSHCAYM